jgi:glutathione-regulated potassium-efflux system ancillary protein KefG
VTSKNNRPNNKKNKILILFAHPSHEKSEVNVPLYEASKSIEDVTIVDLYAEYPNFRINIDIEQQRLIRHDIIVFMFPLYWYSTPAILKEWQDLVLEYGFAYGSTGKALHGKQFFCALSAGGSAKAYRAEGYNHYTIRQLLHPLEQTAVLTGMQYLAPFTLFGSRTAVEENRIGQHVKDWRRLIEAMRDNKFDFEIARDLPKLNRYLSLLIKD